MIRKRTANLLVICFISSTISPVLISAQNLSQFHQLESANYQISINENNITYKQTPIKKGNSSLSSSGLNRTVFGFFPSWLYNDTTINNLRLDLLTHIGIYSFDVDGSGIFKYNRLLAMEKITKFGTAKPSQDYFNY